jgi:hypothetical protein
MTSKPYRELSEANKESHRKWQRARQRALIDLQTLHPDEYASLLEAHLRELGVKRLVPR